MKKPDLNTSKILLILLGVLVAIVIGFNSKAFTTSSNHMEWLNSSMEIPKDFHKSLIPEVKEKVVSFLTEHL